MRLQCRSHARCGLFLLVFAMSCGDGKQSTNNKNVNTSEDMGTVRDANVVPDTGGSTDASSPPDVRVPDAATDMSVPEDASTDASLDLGSDAQNVDMCVPESTLQFCEPNVAACGLVSQPNNCGTPGNVNCGTCPAGESCFANECNCVPEVNVTFCQRYTLNCGDATRVDNCGLMRTVPCGTCILPATCGGGGTPNVCACGQQTDLEFCTSMGAECGAVSGLDSCGQTRTLSCGTCTSPQTCGGGGPANVCGCTSDSDAALCAGAGATCGLLSTVDNCGQMRRIDCGGCTAPQTCGGGGVANTCGCTASSEAELCASNSMNCGQASVDDGCGQTLDISCGACSAPESCGGDGSPNVCGCPADSDADLCAAAGASCGPISVTDNCGQQRDPDCGGCVAPQDCGGGGVPMTCGCTPETNAELCAASAAVCGQIVRIDSCGAGRSVACGTCASGTCDALRNQCVLAFSSMPALALSDTIGVVSDSILVSGCAQIGAVTVDVDITHTFRGDVEVSLMGPSGTVVVLKSPSADPGADLIGNYPNTLTPTESLDVFTSESADGSWTMGVLDAVALDDGTWNNWTLNFFCL